ncbi:RICIN domain-containing protein [Comamonas sp. JC664]|uniref:RICIN domain-containing protein n=1 Tax=Comamonas sp. JC664 TaxID=2801917 RepID=UPI00188B115B|nr:RICIN domain-containing protein [Comamonas sp. JC664]
MAPPGSPGIGWRSLRGQLRKVTLWLSPPYPNEAPRRRTTFPKAGCARFGRNDFYPFTCEELGRHDPDMLALLQQVWQVPPTTTDTSPTNSAPPPMPVAFDARCYYRLTTLWQGKGMSLDILSDGKANNLPILAMSGDYSGQMWKLTPEANGFYRLTTQAQGDALSRDIVNDGRANNSPVLAKTGCNGSGQLRKVTTVRMSPEPVVEDSP